jgi:hypothetical protein
MIYADVGPLTKTTTQNILDDDIVEYVQISHASTAICTSEEIQYQDAGKMNTSNIHYNHCIKDGV